ncbi:MAG: TorF family putative porin [Gallionella sp.]
MKKKFLVALGLSLFAIAPAFAEEVMLSEEVIPAEEVTSEASVKSGLSGDLTLTSNYIYRGVTQTAGSPTIQGGIDYVHSSHFYLGAWGSGASIFRDLNTATAGAEGAPNSRFELDTYFGYKNAINKDLGYDLGYLRYNFPGSYPVGATKADTDELYAALSYKWLMAKYSYSLGNTFANANTTGTHYLEIEATYHIESMGLALGARYGKQTFRGAGAILLGNSLSYSDYKLSITKELAKKYELSLEYTNTNATAAYTVLGRPLGKSAVTVSLTRLF